jgi:hypothetical protein
MANNSESRGRGRDKGSMDQESIKQGSTQGSTRSHESSGLTGTQSRSRQKTSGGPGERISSGRPDAGGNRSGGQGNVSQQSDVDTNGGAPSRQTSTASNESGQL